MGFGWEVPHDDSAYLSPLGTNRRATSSGSRLPMLNPCHAGRTTKRCSVICGLRLPPEARGYRLGFFLYCSSMDAKVSTRTSRLRSGARGYRPGLFA